MTLPETPLLAFLATFVLAMMVGVGIASAGALVMLVVSMVVKVVEVVCVYVRWWGAFEVAEEGE